jgi:hypothetical protein
LEAQLTPQETAILVEADGVSLDLGGFRLSGRGGFAVRATGRREIVVRNGAIRGFRRGVALDGSGGLHVVEALKIESRDEALRVQGRGSTIRSNTLARQSPGPSLIVRGALSRILGNDVALAPAHTGAAIEIREAGGTIVERNRLSGQPSHGSVGVAFVSGDDVLVLENDLMASEQGVAFQGARGVSRGNLERNGGGDAR